MELPGAPAVDSSVMDAAMLTARQEASMLGVSTRFVYDLAARGALVAYRIGRRVVFDAAHIRGFKESCKTASRSVEPAAPATDKALLRAFARAGARVSPGGRKP